MAAQTESLRSLTLDVISNYRKTAKYASQALRAGSTRSIGKVDSALSKYEGKFGETVKSTLDVTQEKIVAATNKADEALGKLGDSVKSSLANTQDAITTVTDKADTAVDKLLNTATKGIAKFPPKTGKFASLLKNDAVKSAESFGIPGVKFLRFVSAKLADGAEQLSIQATGAKKKAAPAKKAALVRKVVSKAKAVANKPVAKPVVRKVVRKTKAATV
jgi:hypothetical protein